jgi:hypothetical protein
MRNEASGVFPQALPIHVRTKTGPESCALLESSHSVPSHSHTPKDQQGGVCKGPDDRFRHTSDTADSRYRVWKNTDSSRPTVTTIQVPNRGKERKPEVSPSAHSRWNPRRTPVMSIFYLKDRLDFSRPHTIPHRVPRCHGIVCRWCEAFRGHESLARKDAQTGGFTFRIYLSFHRKTHPSTPPDDVLQSIHNRVQAFSSRVEDGGEFVQVCPRACG